MESCRCYSLHWNAFLERFFERLMFSLFFNKINSSFSFLLPPLPVYSLFSNINITSRGDIATENVFHLCIDSIPHFSFDTNHLPIIQHNSCLSLSRLPKCRTPFSHSRRHNLHNHLTSRPSTFQHFPKRLCPTRQSTFTL